MVFGTFDYLHAGHENLFEQAKKYGDYLIAIIALDHTVKKIKSQETDHSEKERLKNLQATGWADKVILGDNKDKAKAIKQYRPDIIALGYDQFAFTYNLKQVILKEKMDTKIVRLQPYKPEMYKSSIIKAAKENSL